MFDVVRWTGPETAAADATSKQQKNKGGVSLQQLNARARERAESRRIQAVVEGAPRISDEGGVLSSIDVHGNYLIPDAGLGQTVGDEGKEAVRKVSKKEKKRNKREGNVGDEGKDAVRKVSKKEKKRNKRGGIDEKSEKVEEVLEKNELASPHLDDNVKKRHKKRVSQAMEQDKPSEEVHPELAHESDAPEGKVPVLDDTGIPTKEKKGKKKKRKLSPESTLQMGSLENVKEVPSTSDVSAPLLPASLDSHASGNARDAEREDMSEKADVGVAGETTKEKRRKKRKVVIEVVEALDHETRIEDRTVLDSSAEMPTEKFDDVPAQEFDLSRIERDVEMIMGKLPGKTAAEGQGKTPPVLPWMRDPLEIGSYKVSPLNQVPGLDVRLQAALKLTGIEALFPVQVAVWHETVGPGHCERDLCVCSPTGSGKTLSYALPIVQKLSARIIRRLRALIVLPTRDLATQVKAVFDTIAPSVGLKVGLAVGQTSIVAEAAALVKFQKETLHSFQVDELSDYDFAESCVDILVATPGRLMDHLRNTKGFTLQHLCYLVVDETDRLLRQSYQDWLSNVLTTVATTESGKKFITPRDSGFNRPTLRSVRTIRHLGFERGIRGNVYPRLMKMVLSATLTRDPSKIAQLVLHRPMYIAQGAVENRYQLPEGLHAFKLVCKPGEKPLYLVALLQQLVGQQTIVFTASVVATHRLFTLLSSFEGLSFKVVEYSSLQHQQARSKSLARFRDREVQVLVASDAMTRGMDVEGVGNVINYDMPVYAKTYVHRVGRTARAGRAGCSYTLLRRQEVRHFKSLLNKADNSSCKDYSLPASATQELYERYLAALEKLKQITQQETTSATASNGAQVQGLIGEQGGMGADELFM